MDPLLVLTLFLGASAGFVQCSPIPNPQIESVTSDSDSLKIIPSTGSDVPGTTITENRSSTNNAVVPDLLKAVNQLLAELLGGGGSGSGQTGFQGTGSFSNGTNVGGNANNGVVQKLLNLIVQLLNELLGDPGNGSSTNNAVVPDLLKAVNQLLAGLLGGGSSGSGQTGFQGTTLGCCSNCTCTCYGTNVGGNANNGVVQQLLNLIVQLLNELLGNPGNGSSTNNAVVPELLKAVNQLLAGLLGGGGSGPGQTGYQGTGSFSNCTCTCYGKNAGGTANNGIVQQLLNLIVQLLTNLLGNPGGNGSSNDNGVVPDLLTAIKQLLDGLLGGGGSGLPSGNGNSTNDGLVQLVLNLVNQLLKAVLGGNNSGQPVAGNGNNTNCYLSCNGQCGPLQQEPQDICDLLRKFIAALLQDGEVNENDLKTYLSFFLQRCEGSTPCDKNCCADTCDLLQKVLALILNSGKEIDRCLLNNILLSIDRECGENCKCLYPHTQQLLQGGSTYMTPSNKLTMFPDRLPIQMCQACLPKGMYNCPSSPGKDDFHLLSTYN